MLLSDLLKNTQEKKQLNFKKFNPLIKGLSSNSKDIKKGFVFVAIKGKNFDGHKFIDEAKKKGAKFIAVSSKKIIKKLKKNKIEFVISKNIRFFLSKISSNFFKNQPSFLSAVTGTNGKTSVTHITKEIWKNCNVNSGSIGTIGIITNKKKRKVELTTLDSIYLHQTLNSFYKKNIKKVCLEASSHGLDQNRIDNIKLKTAAITNITHDHLDYHKNYKLYFQSKMKLFKDILISKGTAVINSDLPESRYIEKLCKKQNNIIITYGKKSNDLKLIKYENDKNYQKIFIKFKNKIFSFKLPLIGYFQVYNALCSIGIIISSGISLKKCLKNIEKIKQIPGRLEKINVPKILKNKKISIFIDYAHTPDALKKVLETLKQTSLGQLSLVFGCGGNRDLKKRPLMGKIARKLADKIYVTDDNPRNESAAKIRKEILLNCPNGKEIASRQIAIKQAINNCSFGETLLIAGKGHEDFQEIKNKIKKFNDKEIVLKILNSKALN